MRITRFLTGLVIISSLLISQGITFTEHFYTGSDENFPNPERGFSSFRTQPLTLSYCQGIRADNMTLIQRIHTMPQFNSGPISQSYLDMMEDEGSGKVVLGLRNAQLELAAGVTRVYECETLILKFPGAPSRRSPLVH